MIYALLFYFVFLFYFSSNSSLLGEGRVRSSSPLSKSFSAEDLTRERIARQREQELQREQAIARQREKEKEVSLLVRSLARLSLKESSKRRALSEIQPPRSKRPTPKKEGL
jgi:hypothetical protein